jgi:drug/metabolite transporter (DMT)-like permease
MQQARSVSLMVAAAASWAAATVLTKVTLHEVAPLDLLSIETSSSPALLVAVLLVRGRPFLPRRAPGAAVDKQRCDNIALA